MNELNASATTKHCYPNMIALKPTHLLRSPELSSIFLKSTEFVISSSGILYTARLSQSPSASHSFINYTLFHQPFIFTMQATKFIGLAFFAIAQSKPLQPRSSDNFGLYAYGTGIGGGAVVFKNSMYSFSRHQIVPLLTNVILMQVWLMSPIRQAPVMTLLMQPVKTSTSGQS